MGSKSSFTYFDFPVRLVIGTTVAASNDRARLNKSRVGVDLPFYMRTINNGGNATTNLTAFEETVSLNTNGFFRGLDLSSPFPLQRPRESNKLGINLNVPQQMCPQSLVDLAVARVTSKCFKKIQELQSPFQGQIFLGELRETIELLKNPFGKSLKLTESFLKKRDKLRNIASAASDSWLEYRFGILPLIADANAIIKLIADKTDNHEVLTYRYYDKQSSSSSVVTSTSDVGGFSYLQEAITTYDAECIIRFGIIQKYLEQHETFSSRLMNSVDDLSSIPVTAWELVPYSFLVDYFVNIGDIIQSAVTSTRLLSYQSRSVIRTTTVAKNAYAVIPLGSNTISDFRPRQCTIKRRDVIRDGTQLGIPPIVFHLPGSNIRYANLAALFTSFNLRRSL